MAGFCDFEMYLRDRQMHRCILNGPQIRICKKLPGLDAQWHKQKKSAHLWQITRQ